MQDDVEDLIPALRRETGADPGRVETKLDGVSTRVASLETQKTGLGLMTTTLLRAVRSLDNRPERVEVRVERLEECSRP